MGKVVQAKKTETVNVARNTMVQNIIMTLHDSLTPTIRNVDSRMTLTVTYLSKYTPYHKLPYRVKTVLTISITLFRPWETSAARNRRGPAISR
jgi:hypothetical protein